MDWTMILIALGVLAAIGAIFGLILEFASKKFAVEVDERVGKVRACLAGANCGACGYAGCDAFAEAVVEGKAKVNGSIPGGDNVAKGIAAVLGVDAGESMERKVAKVRCQGSSGVAKDRYEYQGIKSCRAATYHAGGPKLCRYSCVGLGDCVDRCVFNAIRIKNGVAVVDSKLCTGCGACVACCPRSVIELASESDRIDVLCRNSDVGRAAVDVCLKSCIACKRCEKACQYDAIHVKDGIAVIDHDNCTRCGDCAGVCPRHCIVID